MSSRALLKTIAGDAPMLNMKYGILSAPVRHVMMIGTVWHLTRKRKNPDLSILEIGSWYGASALSWAQGLKEHNDSQGTLTCLDGWEPFFDRSLHKDDVYVAMEQALGSDAAYGIFQHNMSTLPATIRRQHLRGKSDALLPLLKDASFDVVYIDADHTYEPVKRDIENSLRLVKEGGIICGDDLNLQMEQVDQDFARKNKLIDFTKDPKTGRNFHPGVTLAVHEIFGPVAMWGGYWAMQRTPGGWSPFSLKDMPVIYPVHFPDEAVERARSHLADISPLA
jgi:predicted O-methyltransferase YrrM